MKLRVEHGRFDAIRLPAILIRARQDTRNDE